jgi:hypothetical protein
VASYGFLATTVDPPLTVVAVPALLVVAVDVDNEPGRAWDTPSSPKIASSPAEVTVATVVPSSQFAPRARRRHQPR